MVGQTIVDVSHVATMRQTHLAKLEGRADFKVSAIIAEHGVIEYLSAGRRTSS